MSLLLPFGLKPHSSLLQQHDLTHPAATASTPHLNNNGADVGDTPDVVGGSHVYQPLPATTYSSCFGLPYQDHNYGAPPPPTPPSSPPPQPSVHVTQQQITPASTGNHKIVNGHIDIENVSCNTEVLTSGGAAAAAAAAAAGTSSATIASTSTCRLLDTPTNQQSALDDSITRCICNFEHDDGYMICCDKCTVWQHVDCMGVDRNNIPDKYNCELCEPRHVDALRAIQLQTKKRPFLVLADTSATETEDETKQSPKRPGPQRGRKKKILDKKENKKKGRKSNKDKDQKTRPFKNKKLQGKVPKMLGPKTPKGAKIPTKVMSPKALSPKALSPILPPVVSPPRPVFEAAPKPWYNNGEGGETYEEAHANKYSIDIDALLIMRKGNGQHDESKPCQLLDRLVNVARVGTDKKGLEAATDIAVNQAMLEYRGKVILREQYEKKDVFYSEPQPYTLFYSKFENTDICIDAISYGNEARFVRRSCCPNSEMRHFVENGSLRFYIFSSKCIPNGAEVTIPFDFNYQDCMYPVNCACSRASCPVVKFHSKKEMPSPSPPKVPKKKKRTNRSTDELADVQIEDPVPPPPIVSPVKVQPPPLKRRRLSPLRMSAPVREYSYVTPVKEETLVKVTSAPTTPAAGSGAHSSSMQSPTDDTESDTETSEKKKKKSMSREDRKLEAIMKAFERMEKREERRKEALARLGKSEDLDMEGHIDEKEFKSKVCKTPPHSTIEEKPEVEEVEEPTSPPPPPPPPPPLPPPLPPPPVPVVQPAPVPAPTVDPKPDRPVLRSKGKKKKTAPARRRSRVNSGMSSAAESIPSADENSNTAASLPTVSSSPAASASTETTPIQSTSSTPVSSLSDRMFRFPKTKKHLMNEWLIEKNEKIDSIKPAAPVPTPKAAEPLEVQTSAEEEDTAEFVRCVPSPHASSLSHLRRNSSSNANSDKKAVNSASSAQFESMGLGSAKKRWLRQAMFESTSKSEKLETVSPSVTQGAASPNVHNSSTSSPGNSPPVDFVTPLKKRRMARESLSIESPYSATKVTPCNGDNNIETDDKQAVAEEDSAGLINGFKMSPIPLANDNLFEKFGLPPPGQRFNLAATTVKEEHPSDISSPEHYPMPKAKMLMARSRRETLEEQKKQSLLLLKAEVDSIPKLEGEIQPKIEIKEEQSADIKNVSAINSTKSVLSTLHDSAKGSEAADFTPGNVLNLTYENTMSQKIKDQSNVFQDSEKRTETDLVAESSVELRTVAVDIPTVKTERKICDSSDAQKVVGDCSCSSASLDLLHKDIVSSGIGRTEMADAASNRDSDSSVLSENERTCSSTTTVSGTEHNVSRNSECETSKEETEECGSTGVNVVDSDDICLQNSVSAIEQASLLREDVDNEAVAGPAACSSPHRPRTKNIDTIASSSELIHEHACTVEQSEQTRTHNRSLSEGELESSFAADTSSEDLKHKLSEVRICDTVEEQYEGSDEQAVSCSTETKQGAVEGIAQSSITENEVDISDISIESEKEEGEITSSDEEEEDLVGSSSAAAQGPKVDSPPNTPSSLPLSPSEGKPLDSTVASLGMASLGMPSATDGNDGPFASSSTLNSNFAMPWRDTKDSYCGNSVSNEITSTFTGPNPTSPFWDRDRTPNPGKFSGLWKSAATSPRNLNSFHLATSPSTATSSSTFYPEHRPSFDVDSSVDSTSSKDFPRDPRERFADSVSSSINIAEASCSSSFADNLEDGISEHGMMSPSSVSSSSALQYQREKRKVSLADYRKRMKTRPGSSRNGSSSSRCCTPPTPNMALSSRLIGAASSTTKMPPKALPLPLHPVASSTGKDDWNLKATAAEQVREQTQLSLTERLRKEFGLDAASDDENDDEQDSSDDEPPPPPPPPPPPTQPTVQPQPVVMGLQGQSVLPQHLAQCVVSTSSHVATATIMSQPSSMRPGQVQNVPPPYVHAAALLQGVLHQAQQAQQAVGHLPSNSVPPLHMPNSSSQPPPLPMGQQQNLRQPMNQASPLRNSPLNLHVHGNMVPSLAGPAAGMGMPPLHHANVQLPNRLPAPSGPPGLLPTPIVSSSTGSCIPALLPTPSQHPPPSQQQSIPSLMSISTVPTKQLLNPLGGGNGNQGPSSSCPSAGVSGGVGSGVNPGGPGTPPNMYNPSSNVQYAHDNVTDSYMEPGSLPPPIPHGGGGGGGGSQQAAIQPLMAAATGSGGSQTATGNSPIVVNYNHGLG